jgi:hypothetical protein
LRRRLRVLEQEVEGFKEARVAAVERLDTAERTTAHSLEKVAERIERLAHALNGGLGEKSAIG